jgi:group I intron endonuclease
MKMKRKYNYTYLITNKINGKQYVGDHSTNNLNDSYLGSGKLLNKAKEKYGRKNFEKEILEYFDTKEEAFNAQEKYIKKYKTLVEDGGYNISPTGGYAPGHIFSKESIEKRIKKRRPHSAESKDKIRQSLLGKKHTDERRKNLSNAHKGKDFSKNFGPPRYGKDNPSYVQLSKEQITKIIRLHIEEYKTAKQIGHIMNINPAKVLKTLREENVYLTFKELGVKKFNDSKELIIKFHIEDNLNSIQISKVTGLNAQKIINYLKEQNIYRRIDKYKKEYNFNVKTG